MKQTRFARRSISLALAFVVLLSADAAPQLGKAAAITAAAATMAANGAANGTANGSTTGITALTADEWGPYYQDVLAGWNKKGYQAAAQTITIPGSAMTVQSDAKLASVGPYAGKNGVLVWKSGRSNWIDIPVDVPRDGLYEIALSYHAYRGEQQSGAATPGRPANLSLQIDGAFPFREARSLLLRSKFKDELPARRDEYGDDIRPQPVLLDEWMNEPLSDAGGSYLQPLQWYLAKGKHTLRFAGSDPIVIESIALKPPAELRDYAQVAQEYRSARPAAGPVITVQAEEAAWKNDAAIQIVSDQDPLTVPYADGYERFNALGGDRWQTSGQQAAWSFEVPVSGTYKIALRTLQSYVFNMSVFRTIAIDGKVPFRELLAYRFPYSPKWRGTVLGDANGTPYEFYLEKGKHTISMTATAAPYQEVIVQGERATDVLRKVDMEIRGMTGGVVDPNRTWKITQDFPELPKSLEEARAELERMAQEMLKANGRTDSTLQTIETAVHDLTDDLQAPNEIPYHMDDISSIIERIGGLRETLVKSPLRLDQIYIAPTGTKFPRMEAGLWQEITGTFQHFLYSFTRKRDINKVDENVLNVWVNRGRDWVNLLQELANESFTPETGIKVKVNLLPNENLLVLANAAGLSPDVALGQPQDKSIDFAMRNALYDLSAFPDFKMTAGQFAPGALLPFYYNGAYYALPETQNFKVLFYRKDILARLGLKVPDTWQDVYDMLPTLQQKGYNFYVPAGDYLTFFYQNGAEFFARNGMKTALSTPAAFKGFKMWTDLFNIYDLERSVPSFYQHFRKGDFPIGVADYNMYITLAAAAPELSGWWGIAPMPGVKQADGTVARWAAGGQTAGFIYKNTKHPREAWQFLKWLVSADTQEKYGAELEAINGIQFRWNTANIEAFTRLPWPQEDKKVILEQWRWYKEAPNLPGSYFLTRELNNAWNRTVVDGMNDRESLEEAIVNIDREMARKEQEFGFVDAEGNVLHTLDVPQVKTPWEGVDRYVAQ